MKGRSITYDLQRGQDDDLVQFDSEGEVLCGSEFEVDSEVVFERFG